MLESLAGVDPTSLKGKRVLVTRWGAFGDCIVITPLLRWLKKHGAHVVLSVSERGAHILFGNPNVDTWHYHVSDSIPADKDIQADYRAKLASDHKCDYLLNLSGSLEVSISPSPYEPLYSYPKDERRRRCDRNFYEHTFEFVGAKAPTEAEDLRPDIHFTKNEVEGVRSWLGQNLKYKERVMTVCWTGSGRSKMYPYMEYVVGEMLTRHKNLTCVVVGNAKVDVGDLHRQSGGRICSRMTHWTFREAAVAVSLSSVFLGMDTGLLHAAGAFQVPKVGILGHMTVNASTKHFANDYSIQADEALSPCAPCFRIVHDGALQCPIDPDTRGVWCMAYGIPPEKVCDQIEKALKAGVAINGINLGSAVPAFAA